MKRLTERIYLRVTPEQLKLIDEFAKRYGRTRGNYIRWIVLKELKKEKERLIIPV